MLATSVAGQSGDSSTKKAPESGSEQRQKLGLTPRGWKGYLGEALKSYVASNVSQDIKKERACIRMMSDIFSREKVVNGEKAEPVATPIIALIGGWAVYARSGLRRSHDVDVVVNNAGWEDLQEMARQRGWAIKRNEVLRKHEIKAKDWESGESIDIDVYVGYQDELIIPPQKILSDYSTLRSMPYLDQGVRMVSTEALLAMKLVMSADSTRVKDPIDVVGLVTLIVPTPDMHEVGRILNENLRGDPERLGRCLRHFSELMNEMVKGTIAFSNNEDQEKVRQLIDGLGMELKEGALRGGDGLLRRAIGDLF